MKLLVSTVLVIVLALVALALTVVANYRFDLVYPPSIFEWTPAIAGGLALFVGLAVLIRRNALSLPRGAVVSALAVLIAVPAGGFTWLYTACALGDCL